MNKIIEIYLDYFNNYLSVGRFAADYGISTELAQMIIDEGRYLHQLNVGDNPCLLNAVGVV